MWDVDYTNAAAHVTVTGSFVYDADLNQYSAINLTATDDFNVSNTTYIFLSPFAVPTSNGVTFRNQEDADRAGERFIDLSVFGGGLTNAGGVISNAGSAALFIFLPVECVASDCSATSGTGASGDPSRSTLTGTPLPAPVPAGATRTSSTERGALDGRGRLA